jgi:DNA-binding NtrC family response regulator
MHDMRSIPDLETVPIILVTALSLPDIVSQAVTSGAAGFLVKPFDLSTLLNHVDRVLKPKPSEGENEEGK